MKTANSTNSKSERRAMSRTALVFGLFLWATVFASLYFMNSGGPDPNEAGSDVAGGGSDQPIIIDTTNPDHASVSTVKVDFPTRPLLDFDLVNSEGGNFGLKDLKGKRWVASFVFSRCASTCPLITGAMMKVHDRVKGKADDVMFVSITVDPDFDTPNVFQQYAENYRQGESSRWKFLTGSQQEIFELIVKGFGLYVAENLGEDRMAGFEVAHTNRVVLVNEDGVPVATFLGTRDEDMVKLRRILTGKSDFPKPGPALTFGTVNGQPSGLTFEMVPVEDDSQDAAEKPEDENSNAEDAKSGDTNSGAAKLDDAKSENSKVKDNPSSHSGLPSADGSSKTDKDPNLQSALQFDRPKFYLTTASGFQGDADVEAKPDVVSETEVAEASSDATEQSIAEFNEALQSRLPIWARNLPTLNAILNSIATVLLLCGYTAIRRKKKSLHRGLMISAFLMSAIFLVSYLTYHYALGKYTGEHGRQFEGTGIWASIYPWVLWPHVVLAVFVPVLAIRVFQLAFREDWDRHRRLARITFPIWLYVSVTGVVIYGMLYHWPVA